MKGFIKKVNDIINVITKPAVRQLPFFVATFLMWVPFTCMEVKNAISDTHYDRILDFMRYFGIAVIYSYLLTCIVHKLNSRWVKIIFYFLSLCFVFVTIAIHKIFQTTITPDILLLVAETNTGEAVEFIKNYALNPNTVVTLIGTLVLGGVIALTEYVFRNVMEVDASCSSLRLLSSCRPLCHVWAFM